MTVNDFPELSFGDKRRSERFVKIVEGIIQQPGSSIPKITDTWYDAKATYGFFKNEDISLSSIIRAVGLYGARMVEGQRVLVIHDTSTISYNDLQARGLGYIDNAAGRGIFCHSTIAATTSGMPLGLLHQVIWSRDIEGLGRAAQRKQKPFAEKESYKWYKGIDAANKLLPTVSKIHVADREADIYELFLKARGEGSDLLIRARHKRKTSDSSDLWKYIGGQKVAAEQTLLIPDSRGKRREEVTLEIRYAPVELHCCSHRDAGEFERLVLTAIDIRQAGSPEEGIHWQLLTTLPVDDAAQAVECMQWYSYRWLIERFHYVLKSGCGIELLQLKSAGSLEKAIATYSLAAFKIMTFTYQSRTTPDVSCEVVLGKHEWQTLWMLKHKTPALPKAPPSLRDATVWIAQMGGFLNRKGDGPPGLKTIWLGYEILLHATNLYTILQKKSG